MIFLVRLSLQDSTLSSQCVREREREREKERERERERDGVEPNLYVCVALLAIE